MLSVSVRKLPQEAAASVGKAVEEEAVMPV